MQSGGLHRLVLFILPVVHSTSLHARNNSDEVSDEERLERHLRVRLEKHSTLAAPRTRHRMSVRVKFGLWLVGADLVETEDLLITHAWARFQWYNPYLEWEPSQYGGVHNVTLPANAMWTPNVELINSLLSTETKSEHDRLRSTDVTVTHDGRVHVVMPATYRTFCWLDMTEYPFDVHFCRLWFQPISKGRFSFSLDEYSPGSPFKIGFGPDAWGMWIILGNETMKPAGRFSDFPCASPLVFMLMLQRRTDFMALFSLVPCFLLVSVSLVAFCLPPERPDRIALATSLFASFTVVLLVVIGLAPPIHAALPKLMVMYASYMILVLSVVPLSAFVGRIRKSRGPMPLLLKLVFVRGIGSCMFACLPPVYPHQLPTTQDTDNERQPTATSIGPEESNTDPESNTRHIYQTNLFDRSVRFIRSVSSRRKKHPANKVNRTPQQLSDWMLLGVVLDRLLLLIFLVCIFVVSYLFFPRFHVPPKN